MSKLQDFQNRLDFSVKNIWRYRRFYPPIDENYRLTLNEGNTPIEKVETILFKREDKNPTGSVKDRGMAYQVSNALACGEKHLVLSSSGNAAISAASFVELGGIKLSVFVSPEIEKGKLSSLQKANIDLHITKSPLKDAAIFRRKYQLRNLRQSVDETAFYGCMSLGFEIFEQLFKYILSTRVSIFIPVSSATNLVGIGSAFKVLKKLDFTERSPEIHAVQTTHINPVSREFDDTPETESVRGNLGLAKALCVRKTQRKDEAIKLIRESNGFGWIVTDPQIREAWDWLEKKGIETSAEGAAALAAMFKAKRTRDLGIPICVLTGKRY